jgi:hypothetical protein
MNVETLFLLVHIDLEVMAFVDQNALFCQVSSAIVLTVSHNN